LRYKDFADIVVCQVSKSVLGEVKSILQLNDKLNSIERV